MEKFVYLDLLNLVDMCIASEAGLPLAVTRVGKAYQNRTADPLR
jgi:hypothetical protein